MKKKLGALALSSSLLLGGAVVGAGPATALTADVDCAVDLDDLLKARVKLENALRKGKVKAIVKAQVRLDRVLDALEDCDIEITL
ncbi:MAG: hypothetical protein ACT4OS_00675 [Acidimicrobiales bacterium]